MLVSNSDNDSDDDDNDDSDDDDDDDDSVMDQYVPMHFCSSSISLIVLVFVALILLYITL